MEARTIEVRKAFAVCEYWERNQDESNIHVQFIHFDKVEVNILDGYEGTIDDAVETVQSVIFNAHL